MTRRLRIFVGILGVTVILLVALIVFAWYELTRSFPPASGSVHMPGLLEEVQIRRDGYGVPHIIATNEHDAIFALGVVHAQDRLWQMDMQRRAAMGELSEVVGPPTIPYDKMFRIIGLRRTAERIEQRLPDETRRRLQWYSDGVNAWIHQAHGSFPVEFDLLRYEPKEWKPLHSILVARLIAWELNLSWWTDVTYGALDEKLGTDRVHDILPTWDYDLSNQPPASPPVKGSVPLAYMHTSQDYRSFMGRPLMPGGSNAWAVAPSRSSTGAAILANDTHLHLTSPAQWYELQYDIPGLLVRGMSIPGVPGVVTGRNDSIAWGVTNLMADDADFFIEQINDSAQTCRRGDVWVPLQIIEEEIPVRNDTAVTLHVRLTSHGPLVTDIVTPLNRTRPGFAASMRWTGYEDDDQVGTFFRLNRARTWEEFVKALSTFTVPGQNFVYADVRGHIGYVCAARIPIRAQGRGLLPVQGWESATDWTGFVPFESLPRQLDPPEGFVASANNKVGADGVPYAIGELWEPSSRIRRLRAELGVPGARFSVRSFEELQNDTYSQYAHDIAPLVEAAFTDSAVGQESAEKIRVYFRNWHHRFDRSDIATTIYQVFLNHLLRNIYSDEMGEDTFHDWCMLVNVPMRVTARLLHDKTSVWFDDVRTPQTETCEMILVRSARETVADLTARLGPAMREWRWEALHTVTLHHPFGMQKPLDRLFDIGPFPYPGGSTSMMSGEYSVTEPYTVTVAASYRQIFDLGDRLHYRSVLPSGESGQVLHPHYDDQTPLWLTGQYRTVSADRTEKGIDELLLLPGGVP
jgi:penicillin G amidase